MRRALPASVAAVLALIVLTGGLIETPGRASAATAGAPSVRATTPTLTAIAPGSVNRTSLRLEATYDAYLKIGWTSRAIWVDVTATITNWSGGPIDRLELNTIAARLGDIRLRPVTVDGEEVDAEVHDQTIVVPLGGVLADDDTVTVRVSFGAKVKADLGGSDWMFTKANGILDLYRWMPWVSRRVNFGRSNTGDPFVTPTSPSVRVRIVTDRLLVLATTGDRVSVSSDGLTQVFEATDVRDFTVTAATDYRTGSRVVDGTTIRVWYRTGTSGAALLDAAVTAFERLEFRLGPYPHPNLKIVQSAGGYGMESPGLIWTPTGAAIANRRYLVTHEIAHQWFYSLVGNDQTTNPYADEAAADFVSRYVTGLKRSSRCSTGRLDLSIYAYSSSCYYEVVYIQGGNLLDVARVRMGSAAFWTALRGYIADHRNEISTTAELLDALDDATSIDLGATLFAPRFPSIY